MDRLAHFTINVNHIAGKHLALTDYLSRNPVLPPQADNTYDEEYVINNILPHYSFISKYGCFSNHLNQSENATEQNERKANNKPRTNDARQQKAIDCIYSDTYTRSSSNNVNNIQHTKLTMDVKTIENIETKYNSAAEITELTTRWKEIVKPGISRMIGENGNATMSPNSFATREKSEERLQLLINNWPQEDLRQKIGPQNKGGYQPQTGHSEQWTVVPFWEMDRPTPVQQHQSDRPGPSSAPTPMEEGEIDSETDQVPSVLGAPAINWARYVGVKSVEYVKMGHAPRISAEEKNDWNLEQAVRETEKNFSTDLQLLMNETTNDPNLLKLWCASKDNSMRRYQTNTNCIKGSCQAGSVLSSWNTESSSPRTSEPQYSAFYTRDIQPSTR